MRTALAGLCLAVVLVSPMQAGLTLADGRLWLDGLLLVGAELYQFEQGGWRQFGVALQRRAANLGLTAEIADEASSRVEFDFNSLSLRDMYLKLNLPSSVDLYAGLLSVPLGFDATTPEGELVVVGRSPMYWLAKPGGPRDVGLVVTWDGLCWLQTAAAVVNGSGSGATDDNSWKDVCARVVYLGSSDAGLELAARGYYGHEGSATVTWLAAGAEARFRRDGFTATGEYQRTIRGAEWMNLAYLQVAHQWWFMVPAVRAAVIDRKDEDLELQVDVALGLRLIGDKVKLSLSYQYHRLLNDWFYGSYGLQLQGGF
ncbi:MAG: hypothetical protein ABIK37_02485 [candidate division WOR-3 bacterium]